jgi:hypothetical protein
MRGASRAETLEIRIRPVDRGGSIMWWGIGIVGFLLYITVLFTLGFTTLRKGHWVMFIFGIVFPLFWVIGALIPPTRPLPA